MLKLGKVNFRRKIETLKKGHSHSRSIILITNKQIYNVILYVQCVHKRHTSDTQLSINWETIQLYLQHNKCGIG